MKVIKRNGKEVDYDPSKITIAISKANKNVRENDRLTKTSIEIITNELTNKFATYGRALDIEEIQDAVEDALLDTGKTKLAKAYIKYRSKRTMLRSNSQVDNNIMTLIRNDNEEIKQENSNKNPTIVSVMRDYMAGEVSKDITRRILLPPDIVEAHDNGLLHFHDADYFAQPIYNCCLLNLDDMLQNGTVISNTKIIKPHSFHTACNIATQIIAQTASSQYGGTTISLTHLAKFVNVSRLALREEVKKEFEDTGIALTDNKINEIAEKRLKKEIRRGVQTLQYQIITLNTTNGQAPFLTITAYLNEAGDDNNLKEDLVMVIEEVLKQRIQGVQNPSGAWVTVAFPKIVYILQEDNAYPGTKYWWLTQLAAKCTAKRMVPDYVSEKIMLKYKLDSNGVGHCYPPMGCRSFLTPDLVDGKPKFYGRFNQGKQSYYALNKFSKFAGSSI